MNTKQQEETLSYFKKHAKKWRRQAEVVSEDKVNVIQQRNNYVLRVIEKREKTKLTLDVGCGTGELVYEIAKRGICAVGVDFAEKMIQLAKDSAKENNCQLAKFAHCSIFDFDFNRAKYDLISANGFIEYISFEQLIEFLEISFRGLRKNGSLVLGSRNRLFNICSLNDFTRCEINEGTANLLLLESMALVEGLSIHKLANQETAPFPSVNQKQLHTGIDVSLRCQYTPAQLIKLLKNKGFTPIHVSPIHIHEAPPKFKDSYPAIHGNISNLLWAYAEDNLSLLPNASSFMVHVKKG